MSEKKEAKKQLHKLRTEYFEALKETAEVVNPYAESFIGNHFQLVPELGQLLIERYRHGKTQLRSAQTRFAYELVGGQDWNEIVPACAALTLKETGYYCLDDYFDLDDKPENMPLSGIPFLSISNGIMAELGNSFSSQQIKNAIHEMYMLDELNGQAVLIEHKMNRDDETAYWQKAHGYNFWEQALKIGGILGGGSEEEIARLAEIGKNIGMAHIVANDTWDFAKDLEDFRAGKYTLPIVYALKNTKGQDNSTLESLFGQKDISEDKKDEVRRIVVQSGAIEYGREKANELCQQAIGLLGYFSDSKARRMIEFATTMTRKNKYYDRLKEYSLHRSS